jgi:hypothetical protein
VEPASRHPLEEYKILCEMMRSYAMLRRRIDAHAPLLRRRLDLRAGVAA